MVADRGRGGAQIDQSARRAIKGAQGGLCQAPPRTDQPIRFMEPRRLASAAVMGEPGEKGGRILRTQPCHEEDRSCDEHGTEPNAGSAAHGGTRLAPREM